MTWIVASFAIEVVAGVLPIPTVVGIVVDAVIYDALVNCANFVSHCPQYPFCFCDDCHHHHHHCSFRQNIFFSFHDRQHYHHHQHHHHQQQPEQHSHWQWNVPIQKILHSLSDGGCRSHRPSINLFVLLYLSRGCVSTDVCFRQQKPASRSYQCMYK